MASTTSCVKIGDSYGEELKTKIGAPQEDCLSPIFIIIYLSKAEEMKVNSENQNFNEITFAGDQNFCFSDKYTIENIHKKNF